VIESSVEFVEPASPTTKKSAVDFHGKEDEEHPGQSAPQRKSGLFVSLVDAVKADAPLVNRLTNNQEYSSVPPDNFDLYTNDTFEGNVTNIPIELQGRT
jgi:hypothetical protein